MLLNKVVIFAPIRTLVSFPNIEIICLRLSHEFLDPQYASFICLGAFSCILAIPDFDLRYRLLTSHPWGLLVRFAIPKCLRLVYCFDSFSARLRFGFSWPFCKKFRQRCDCRWYFLSFPLVSLGLLQEVICLAMMLPLDSAGASCRPLVAIGLLQ